MQNRGLLIGLGVLAAVVVLALVFTQGARHQQPAQPALTTPPAAEEATPEAAEEGEVREIVVEGDEYSFSPGSISVIAGETVRITFRNMGNLPHNFTVSELDIATDTISPGQETSVLFTAEETGDYTSFCSVGNHRALGMEGEVMVE